MMLPKILNTAKLKVKYVLGNHTTLSSYPDAEDVIFELIRDYCGKVAKEIKFTDISKILLKIISHKEFKKYKGITPKNINDILQLSKYVSLKMNTLSI